MSLPSGTPITPGQIFPKEDFAELTAIQELIYSYTVLIVADCVTPEKGVEIGSGVVIEIGAHTLIGTAKHVGGKTPFVGFGKNFHFGLPCPPTPLLQQYLHPSRDLAILEVKPGTAVSALPFEGISDSDPPMDKLALIAGYPWYKRTHSEFLKVKSQLAKASHMGKPIRTNPDEYVLPYPLQGMNLAGDSGLLTADVDLKTPHGFSGGGLWGIRKSIDDGGLVTPERTIRLFGIDYRWSPSSREAMCIPIRRWLTFVWRKYPDLQELIQSRFPEIENDSD